MNRVLAPLPRRRTPGAAILGVMASVALLVAWMFERRVAGLDRPAASILLEFLLVFVVGFGTLVAAGSLTGLLPLRKPRRR